jgi:hypothetical protein
LFGTAIHVLAAVTRLGSKPGSTPRRRVTVATSRPAPVTRTSDNAISATTSAVLRRRWRRPAVMPRPPSAMAATGRVRLACSAGAMPQARVVATATAAANSHAVQPIPISLARGRSAGIDAMSSDCVHIAARTPAEPPMATRTRFSVSSCRINRPRPAPSASRIEISRWRVDARASSRFATFAQPMSRMSATAAENANKRGCTFPTTIDCSGSTRIDQRASDG